MIYSVHHDKPLIFILGCVSGEACLPSSSGNNYKLLSTFEFIKAVSGPVLDMINSVHHDKPLIFILGYVSGEAHLPSSGSE